MEEGGGGQCWDPIFLDSLKTKLKVVGNESYVFESCLNCVTVKIGP